MMKKQATVITMVMLFLTAVTTAISVNAGDWPTFHYDVARTGYTASLAPNTPVSLWNSTLPNAIYSSPVVFNGKVYVGCDNDKIYAMDAKTGNQLWNFTMNNRIRGTPTVARLSGESFDRVYVACDGNWFCCINASTGQQIWINYVWQDGTRGSPLLIGDYVYVAHKWLGNSDRLIEFDARTGHKINEVDTLPGPINSEYQYSSPAYHAGHIYVGQESRVVCYDSGTLAIIWNVTTGGYVYSTPAYYNGKIYFGSADGKTYAVNDIDGTQAWNYTTGSIFSSPAVTDGVMVVASDGTPYCVYALNSTTGATIWYHNMTSRVKSSPAIADGMVFVGTLEGKLLALNFSTGQEVWSWDTGTLGEIWSSPAVANGVIYFGSNDQTLYALKDSIVISVPSRVPTGDVQPWTSINVTVNVTASQGISNVIISYNTSLNATWQNVTMTVQNAETGTYIGAIPGQEPNTIIMYKIIAYDAFGESVEKDGVATWCTIHVIPEFTAMIAVVLLTILSAAIMLARRLSKVRALEH
jgi:outer membrane protein assembly factor BamB